MRLQITPRATDAKQPSAHLPLSPGTGTSKRFIGPAMSPLPSPLMRSARPEGDAKDGNKGKPSEFLELLMARRPAALELPADTDRCVLTSLPTCFNGCCGGCTEDAKAGRSAAHSNEDGARLVCETEPVLGLPSRCVLTEPGAAGIAGNERERSTISGASGCKQVRKACL